MKALVRHANNWSVSSARVVITVSSKMFVAAMLLPLLHVMLPVGNNLRHVLIDVQNVAMKGIVWKSLNDVCNAVQVLVLFYVSILVLLLVMDLLLVPMNILILAWLLVWYIVLADDFPVRLPVRVGFLPKPGILRPLLDWWKAYEWLLKRFRVMLRNTMRRC